MSKFHVAVAFSRPVKNGNRKEPFPNENVTFVHNVLSRVSSSDYASLSHTVTRYGVDDVAESFAMENQILQNQYPAYWFDITKENRRDKAAGIKAREQMIRDLTDSLYGKEDHYAMLLMFHTTENPNEDEGLKSLANFVEKHHPKIQVRYFRLPVASNPTEPATSEQETVTFSSGIPDPFAVPQ